MLPKTFRFIAVNNTGVEMRRNNVDTLAVDYIAWKFNANGALVYSTEVTGALDSFNGGDRLSDGSASDAGADQDNSSNLNLGLHGVFSTIHTSGTADGSIDLYYELATDGGTDWPSNQPDVDVDTDFTHLASIQYSSASGQRSTNFLI